VQFPLCTVVWPRGFALALVTRGPALLGDYFAGLPSDLFNFLPAALFVVVGLGAAAGMIALYRLTRPAIPDDERAALRWLLPGAAGSLLLAAGGFPGGRLLLFASFGFAFLVAVLIHRGAQRLAPLHPVLADGVALVLRTAIQGPPAPTLPLVATPCSKLDRSAKDRRRICAELV